MSAYPLLILFLTTLASCQKLKPFNIEEPLSLTISPKIWNILEAKAGVIENAVKSIKIPDVDEKKGKTSFKVWNIKITKFKVPKSGVSFENINNGVHLKIKGVQLDTRATAKGEVRYKILFIKGRLLRMTGEVTGTTNDLNVDAKLSWKDFRITPVVSVKSNLRLKFHGHTKILNLFKEKFVRAIDKGLESLAAEAIAKEVNPHLQEFKRKMEAEGFTFYTVQLSVQKNSLHVAIKPRRAANVITPLIPINNMFCLNANMLALLNAIQGRQKRDVNGNKVDVTCVSPQFNCKMPTTYSLCSDIDIKYSPGKTDKFHNCIPSTLFD